VGARSLQLEHSKSARQAFIVIWSSCYLPADLDSRPFPLDNLVPAKPALHYSGCLPFDSTTASSICYSWILHLRTFAPLRTGLCPVSISGVCDFFFSVSLPGAPRTARKSLGPGLSFPRTTCFPQTLVLSKQRQRTPSPTRHHGRPI
jgi:hypothetical protein